MGTANMKVFICLTTVLAAASAAAQIYARPAVLARPAGQVSHQSVSKPFQGEHRSTVQSKAFGAGVASVADAPNRLHGARGVIAHPVAHAIARPVAVAHAVAPTVAVAHPVAVAHAPVYGKPAPAYAADDLAEVSPYSYNYAVADDYSGAAFNQAESNDGNGVVEGSYTVNLPDGRVQTVKYSANDYDGLVSEVTYEGTASYPETPVVAHAPVLAHPVAHAPVLAHPVAVASWCCCCSSWLTI